jgi:hypothetical protein
MLQSLVPQRRMGRKCDEYTAQPRCVTVTCSYKVVFPPPREHKS